MSQTSIQHTRPCADEVVEDGKTMERKMYLLPKELDGKWRLHFEQLGRQADELSAKQPLYRRQTEGPFKSEMYGH